MTFVRSILLCLSFLPFSYLFAAQSPCLKGSAQECNSGKEGWRQIAVQHYDKDSPIVSIWEKNAQRVICIEPGPPSCAAYGGDIEQFKADAERETAARAKREKEEKDRQAAISAELKKQRKDHGEELLKNGWKEIARCDDGHEWAYVIEKSSERRLCTGINARGGPTEYPCTSFTKDLESFMRLADAARKYRAEYNSASSSGMLTEFLDKKRATNSTPRCWGDGN
jgi:hypothetical protein